MGKQLRWGVCGTGNICSDFVTSALVYADPEELKFYGVAARCFEKAKSFAEKHGIEKAFKSYGELAKDPNIDIIYVGTVNPTHYHLGKLALENGKHVIIETTFCMNLKETKELLDLAKRNKLFIMEAIWSRFLPAWKELGQELKRNSIGDVKQVLVTFGLDLSSLDRLSLKETGGGSILETGTYCAQFASFVFNGEKPVKVVSAGHLNQNGVDDSTSTTVLYEGGRTATFLTHNLIKLPNEGLVIGTKGTITVHDFWSSTKITTPGGTREFPFPPSPKAFIFGGSEGLSCQCKEIYRCIQNGLIESPVIPHKEMLLIAEILESMRKQVGVIFPQDDQ